MRYPKFLPKNGTIGFVAPAFGCDTEPYKTAFENSLKTWDRMGYKTHLGPNVYAGCGLGISNTPEKCGSELTEEYCSDASDVLISCGGGELMCEVIPYMDFERMKAAEPKWFMGYSDNTNFTFLSATIMDTAAVYGPCAAAFGMETWHESLNDAYGVLSGKVNAVSNYDMWEKESLKDEDHPLVPYNLTEGTVLVCYPDDLCVMGGRLLGGCLDTLANLVGTKYDKVKEFNNRYYKDGVIWFLEACDLNVMSIRRALFQLREAGWFEEAKGFIIGRPLCFGEEAFGLNQYNAVTDILDPLGVPVIMDADIGHLAPMMPIICGGSAKVVYAGGSLGITYTFE
ncbi:MAG: LD-carboxypeptidase [Eubacterium sp.]|nr:LD-carboxypeptidase [Eubacterium sp.]